MPPARTSGVAFGEAVEPHEERTAEGDTPPANGARGRRRAARREGLLASPVAVAALVAALALPLVVALIELRSPRWYPVLDLAWTELRVRDVWSRHPPLIGLAGRIGRQGSHPGPMSFFAMWPVYRLFGGTAWALQVAAVAVHVVAMGTALWVAARRGGVRLAVAVAVVLVVLVRAHGPGTLTEPWNPWLPLLWWMVFLLAVWSVALDDAPLLPLAVLAGSFCMQTHVPYVGITSGLLALAFVAVVVHGWRHRAEGGARRALVWGLVAAAVGVVVWFPPILDELRHSPGNLDVLRDYFSDPPEDPIGLRDGAELFLVHLNPWRLVPTIVPESWAFSSSLVPGSVVLGVWAVAAVLSWRLRQRTVSALHLVIAAASVLAVISMSRIFGYVWYYLTLWAWGITTFMVLATVWTLVLLVGPRLRDPLGGRAVTVATVALAGVVVLWSARFALDATDVRQPSPAGSEALGAVAPDTVDALDHGAVPGGGRDGRYLVTWFDPISIGSTGFGLLLELERQGFDVGATPAQRAAVTPHRVLGPGRATGEVHLAVGGEADAWRARPGVAEVATFDPRSSEERAEYDRLRRELIERLRAADLADLVPGVDENLFGTSTDPRIPSPAHRLMVRMLELGLPTSVFVAPPGGEPARG